MFADLVAGLSVSEAKALLWVHCGKRDDLRLLNWYGSELDRLAERSLIHLDDDGAFELALDGRILVGHAASMAELLARAFERRRP